MAPAPRGRRADGQFQAGREPANARVARAARFRSRLAVAAIRTISVITLAAPAQVPGDRHREEVHDAGRRHGKDSIPVLSKDTARE